MERISENRNFLIRETRFRDYDWFARWETDPEVTEFLSFDEDRTYEDVVNEAIMFKGNDTIMDLVVEDKKKEKPIGRIIITHIDRHSDSLDITKFYIGSGEYRGRGIGGEIMRMLLEYLFTFMHMERVSLDYYAGNKRAMTLYEKLGFSKEGVARHATKKDGRYYDLHLMSMLRTEFFAK
ncbi:MAG: GNAT family protein [Bacillota bacterium]|nr:GNAT family protein [Bacillota bacterium]